MTDQPPRLRSAFQFRAIEQHRSELEKLWHHDPELTRRGERLATLRCAEAYLIWLGLPEEPKAIKQALERREKGRNWEQRVPGLDRVLGALDRVAAAVAQRLGLSAALLRTVHGLMDAAGSGTLSAYREQELPPEFPEHQPLPPERVPGAIERSIDWFQSQGIRELHALERAALVTARLSSISPFECANLPAATLMASYCLMESGFFVPAFYPRERTQLLRALQAGETLHTQPLVDLHVELQLAAMEALREVCGP